MSATKDTIERMKLALGISKNKELAEELNISLSAINNWRQRKEIPEANILKVAHMSGFLEEWIKTGEGPQTPFEDKMKEDVNAAMSEFFPEMTEYSVVVNLTEGTYKQLGKVAQSKDIKIEQLCEMILTLWEQK